MKYKNDSRYSILLLVFFTTGISILTSFLLLILKEIGFKEDNIVVSYILSVLITSLLTRGYIYSIMASLLSMLSFNYFFIEPVYSLKVYDRNYIVTFGVMLFSSIIASTQANRLIQSKVLAERRAQQSRTLYQVATSLAKTSEVPELFTVAIQFMVKLFERDVTAIIMGSKGNTSVKLKIEKGSNQVVSGNVGIDNVNEFLSGMYSLPIRYHEKIAGFICLPKELEKMEEEQQFMLDSIRIQITNAVERILLVKEKETARLETDRERFKSNLLRSISHDLRTPLTRISGAAEMISHKEDMNEINNLSREINEEAKWLMRLVENILYLTKIQEDRLQVHLQQEAVEEVVAGAVRRSLKYFPGRNIRIKVPEDVLFVPMDGKLIEQVLINLINNAIEHSNPQDEIQVQVFTEGEQAWFEVTDHGSGIREEDLPRVFDTFFVSNRTRKDGIRGMGLGLAICKEIVNYHGGSITVRNNKEGGATFRFNLHR